MLRDALLSTALYVCLGCAARVLGARYQRREARENVHTTQPTDTDMTVAIPIPVAPAGEVRVVVPESEAIFAGSTLNAPHGQMATDSAPRRSERVTRQPAKLIDAPDAYAAPITPLRNVACERKTVTAEMRAIGLRPSLLITFLASRTSLIGFSLEWGGTTRLGYTDVLVVRKIDCGNWLDREYMPAHQHCELFYPLDRGLAGSALKRGRPIVLRSGSVSWVPSG